MTTEADEKTILTPEEAEALFPEGDTVHNFANPAGGLMIGCDYERADAIKALNAAKQIEIGGPGCMAMRHPIAVIEKNGRITFFEADMDKVAVFEAARAKQAA